MQTLGTLPQVFFRGGAVLTPRLGIDVLRERHTDFLRTDRGVSLFDDPAKAARFGAVHMVESFPAGLKIQQRGRDHSHYELMPAEPMTFERYAELLTHIALHPVQGMP